MKIINRVAYGCQSPWWHGYVRHDAWRAEILTAPIPLSLVLRAAYLLWCWLRYPWRENLIEGREKLLNERVARIKERSLQTDRSAAFWNIDGT